MFSTLRNRFGIPGVISVIALVFAMFGGAYAATSSSGGGKATASAKAKKGPRGPKGATGPAGPTGPPGTNGTNGKDGAAGEKGKDGTNGTPGAAGKSVVATPFEGTNEPPGVDCEERDGVKFQVEGSTQVSAACNGAPGSPWTAGGTLPVGATETGGWSYHAQYEDKFDIAALSFPVRLQSGLDAEHVVYVEGAENPDPTHCPGTYEEPTAASGYLCVYEGSAPWSGNFSEVDKQIGTLLGASPFGVYVPGASTAGALLWLSIEGELAKEEEAIPAGGGSFAVTG